VIKVFRFIVKYFIVWCYKINKKSLIFIKQKTALLLKSGFIVFGLLFIYKLIFNFIFFKISRFNKTNSVEKFYCTIVLSVCNRNYFCKPYIIKSKFGSQFHRCCHKTFSMKFRFQNTTQFSDSMIKSTIIA